MVEPLNWRERLFGRSRTGRLLDILEADRAQTTALLSAVLEQSKAAMDLSAKQYALMTQPGSPPEVRLMTPAIEAEFERKRNADAAPSSIIPADLLRDLNAQFHSDSLSF